MDKQDCVSMGQHKQGVFGPMPFPYGVKLDRVEPDAVIEAFREIGGTPIRGKSIEGECYCGLAAMAAKHYRHLESSKGRPGFDILAKHWLGLDVAYTNGFVNGWDDQDRPCEGHGSARYESGLSDGIAAWTACLDSGLAEEVS